MKFYLVIPLFNAIGKVMWGNELSNNFLKNSQGFTEKRGTWLSYAFFIAAKIRNAFRIYA